MWKGRSSQEAGKEDGWSVLIAEGEIEMAELCDVGDGGKEI